MKISYDLELTLRDKQLLKESNDITLNDLLNISELEIRGCESIDGIKYIKNLKKLIIESYDFSKMTFDVDLDFNHYINKITNFSEISSLTELEELTIINDMFVEKIDISKLRKLRKLVLTNNPNLKYIYGLDKLKMLDEIILYGNGIKQIINMKEYIENTQFASPNILDTDFYLNLINATIAQGHDNTELKFITEKQLKGETNIRFSELCGILDYTDNVPQDLEELYKKINAYLRKNDAYSMNEEEKLRFVFNYIINNIKFNSEELMIRNAIYSNEYTKYDDSKKERLSVYLKHLHNGYTTYKLKSGNCEGRINLMHFMYSLLGIETNNIHCIDKRDNSLSPNHSIIRVNKYNKYIDPSYMYDKKDPYKLTEGEQKIMDDYTFLH